MRVLGVRYVFFFGGSTHEDMVVRIPCLRCAPCDPIFSCFFQVGAHKWTWWFVSLVFAILLVIQLAKMVMAENVSEIAKMLTCELTQFSF